MQSPIDNSSQKPEIVNTLNNFINCLALESLLHDVKTMDKLKIVLKQKDKEKLAIILSELTTNSYIQ